MNTNDEHEKEKKKKNDDDDDDDEQERREEKKNDELGTQLMFCIDLGFGISCLGFRTLQKGHLHRC